MNPPSDQETIANLSLLQEAVSHLYETCEQRLNQANKTLEQAKLIQTSIEAIQFTQNAIEQVGGENGLKSLVTKLDKIHDIVIESNLQERLDKWEKIDIGSLSQLNQQVLDQIAELGGRETFQQLREEIQQTLSATQNFADQRDDLLQLYHQIRRESIQINQMYQEFRESEANNLTSIRTDLAEQIEQLRNSMKNLSEWRSSIWNWRFFAVVVGLIFLISMIAVRLTVMLIRY